MGRHADARPDTPTRVCSDCHAEKPREDFRQRSGRPLGQRESVCRDCKCRRRRELHRGLKLALGKASSTLHKHYRPMRHACALLQMAITAHQRGNVPELLRCLSKAELMLDRMLPKKVTPHADSLPTP
jgi:hypothetical protein